MTLDAVSVLRQYGMGLAEELVHAAQLEGIELAAAATIISMESNGRNVWGSDPVSTGGAYTKGGAVTKTNYLAYRSLMKAGKIGRQGCGPAQCTSSGYQDVADALGGCWDPVANYRSGFRGLQRLIAAYGTRDGARRYNGSGPAAERYAATFMARYATWKQRLAGATVPPAPAPKPPVEDDMFTDDDRKVLLENNRILRDIWQQLAGPGSAPGEFTGWPSFPNGTPEFKATLVDYARHADEQLHKGAQS
jgi:hypothetical protein